MLEIEELAEELKTWAVKHRLEERAVQHFWGYVEEYKKVEPEEFAETFPQFERGAFMLRVVKVSYTMYWHKGDDGFVTARIRIIYRQKEIGWLDVVYRVSGEYLTDVSHFEVTQHQGRKEFT